MYPDRELAFLEVFAFDVGDSFALGDSVFGQGLACGILESFMLTSGNEALLGGLPKDFLCMSLQMKSNY